LSFKPNTIYAGDSKEVLRRFPEKSIDLIYLDPPFFSNRHYEVIWDDGYELRAFEDRWKGGIQNYVAWMIERLNECRRILKDTGSIYLHCDWHAAGYLRVEMDKIFGSENFRSEIIWRRQNAHSDSKQGARNYGHIHDNILFYTCSPDTYIWNQQYTEYDESYINNFYKHVELPNGNTRLLTKEEMSKPSTIKGRRFRVGDLTAAKAGGDTSYSWHGKQPYKGRYWAYSKEKMEKLDSEGRIVYLKTGTPAYKRYLDEMPGVTLQDLWLDINPAGLGKESLGYPTQKPEVLMERIVKTSSNAMDIVLDPFCGCGTTIAAAHKLGRRWVGIDVSPTACKLMQKRMRSIYAKDVEIIGMPKTEKELDKLQPFEFQNWVFERLHGRMNPRKSGDMGIDGWVELNVPLQVKQSERIGRNVVDNFETAIKRYYGSGLKELRGVIVAFSFTKDAYEEVARVKNQENIDIKLMTVEEILNMS
jgi:DNA modification methylase